MSSERGRSHTADPVADREPTTALPSTLHGHLCARNPDAVRTVVSRAAMTQTARLLRRIMAVDGEDGLVVAGFQHARHWRRVAQRRDAPQPKTIVLAVPDHHGPVPLAPGVSFVPLPGDHPFADESFLVGVGPTTSVLLCGLDLHRARGSGPIQPSRVFDVLLSTDPKLTSEALEFIGEQPGLAIPGHGRFRMRRFAERRGWERREARGPGLTDHVLGAMLRQNDELAVQQVELRERVDRELVDVRDQERARLVEAIHDGSLQQLISVWQDLEEVDDLDPAALRESVREAREGLGDGLARLRDEIHHLHRREARDDLTERLVAIGERQGRRGGFVTTVQVAPAAAGLDDEQVVACVRELVTNAAKHAAASNVRVDIGLRDDPARLVIDVSDDGRGMSGSTLATALAEGHIGLSLAASRIRSAGGDWRMTTAPECGVRVRATVPVAAPSADPS